MSQIPSPTKALFGWGLKVVYDSDIFEKSKFKKSQIDIGTFLFQPPTPRWGIFFQIFPILDYDTFPKYFYV